MLGKVTVLVVPGEPVNLITACLPLLSAVPSAKAKVTLPDATLTSTYPPMASSNKSMRDSFNTSPHVPIFSQSVCFTKPNCV